MSCIHNRDFFFFFHSEIELWHKRSKLLKMDAITTTSSKRSDAIEEKNYFSHFLYSYLNINQNRKYFFLPKEYMLIFLLFSYFYI